MKQFSFVLFLSILALSCNLAISAQQPGPCSSAVATCVVFPDGRTARGLNSTHFIARMDGKPVEISVVPDTSPRRILLLMDFSKKISDDMWQAIVFAASHVVEEARPEDRFALMTFGGPQEFLGFEGSRFTLKERLSAYGKARPGSAGGRVLTIDALADGLKAFGPAQYGDTILLFFGGEDTGSKKSLSDVGHAFSQSDVRIFGIVFGVLYQGTIVNSLAPGGPITYVDYGNEFHNLVVSTGGTIMVGYSGDPWKTYKLTEARRNELGTAAWRLYGQIVETYRIEIHATRGGEPEDWKLDLSPELLKKYPGLAVRRRQKLVPCAPTF